MVNELICTNLITTEQIKEEFSIYYIDYGNRVGFSFRTRNKKIKKYSYFMALQLGKLREILDIMVVHIKDKKYTYYSNQQIFLDKVINDMNSDKIPKKYQPIEKIVYSEDNFKIIQLIFKEQLISYLEQKPDLSFYSPLISILEVSKYSQLKNRNMSDKEYKEYIILFFRCLSEFEGNTDFDEFIDNWANKLLEEGEKE